MNAAQGKRYLTMQAALLQILDVTAERGIIEPYADDELAERIAVLADECKANIAMYARIPRDGFEYNCLAEWGVPHPIRYGNAPFWKPAPGQLQFRSFDSDPDDLWKFTRMHTGEEYKLTIDYDKYQMIWTFTSPASTHTYAFRLVKGVYILISKARNGAPHKVYDRTSGFPIGDADQRAMVELCNNAKLYTLLGANTFQQSAAILLEVGPQMQNALAAMGNLSDVVTDYFCMVGVARPIRRAHFRVEMDEGYITAFDKFTTLNTTFMDEDGASVIFDVACTDILLQLTFSRAGMFTRTYTFYLDEEIFHLRRITHCNLHDNTSQVDNYARQPDSVSQ